MRRLAPCAQWPCGVTRPLPRSRVEPWGIFCPQAPGAPIGDPDRIGGLDPYLGGSVCINVGPRLSRGSGLRTWGFGTHPWGSKPVSEVP
jgi:hypothetical protein